MPKDGLNTVPLTSIRFFAALGVAVYHRPIIPWLPDWFKHLSLDGGVFVTLFFVLSGLILTRVYRSEEWTKSGIRAYLVKRVARVAPVYYLSLLVGIPFMIRMLQGDPLLGQTTTLARWGFLHLTFLTWVEPRSAFEMWLNPPSWSLGVEVVFYALFPFLLKWANARLKTERSIVICFVAILGFQFAKSVLFGALRLPDTSPGLSTFSYVQMCNPFLRLPEFMIGILLALYLESKTAWRGRGTPTFVGSALLFSTSALWPTAIEPAVQLLSIITLIGSGLYLGPVAGRIMSHPWLEKLGHASFALYLLHMPLQVLVIAVFLKTTHYLLPNFLSLLICQAICIVVYQKFESPFRKRIIQRLLAPIPVG